MNAMTNFTIKSLRANKARTLVTIVGVILAAALLTAVLTTFSSLMNFMYETEVATSGTWMSRVETQTSPSFEEDIAKAESAEDVTDVACLKDIGFAELTKKQQDKLGYYQTVLAYEGDVETMLGIHASEGRLPQNEDEVLLYGVWNTLEGVSLGDQITLDVGERMVVAAEGAEGWNTRGDNDIAFAPGTVLDSSTGYLNSEIDGTDLDEALVDKERRTYTVVGFYDRANYSLYSGVGTVALTAGGAPQDAFTEVYLSMDNVSSSEQLKERTLALFPDTGIEVHSNLLRFMGISSDTSIWTTFYGLVVILAVVIILACVSLIFNAFAISVAERITQFGLLSSVGATRRQLRRAVILEALVIAVIGVPVGILVGLGGCAITFAALGPGISTTMGNGSAPFDINIDIPVLLITAALTVITVLISVWVPAKRASRANIISSLKSADGARVSKRGEKQAAQATKPNKLWKGSGVFARFFGVGGKLATINRKRGASKGRTASISLALAIVLLMTAGSLNTFLGTLVSAVTQGDDRAGEVAITASLTTDEAPLDAPFTAQALMEAYDEQQSRIMQTYGDAYDYLSSTENAVPKGWMVYNTMAVTFPENMATDKLSKSDSTYTGQLANGDYAALSQLYFVDDESFDEYAKSNGIDPQKFYDADEPSAIGISRCYGNDGSTYQLIDTLKETGDIQVIGVATYMDRYTATVTVEQDRIESGKGTCELLPVVHTNDEQILDKKISIDDVDYASSTIHVSALAEEPPAVIGGNGSIVSFIMPASVAFQNSFGSDYIAFKSEFDAADGDHEVVSEALSDRANEFFANVAPYETSFVSINDYKAEADSTQMLATIINVFCLLFTVILALISMANVFNTVTNSLILRKREFAVMRSIGLSNSQFRRMITDECMRFGLAGLIPGLIVSVGVSYLVYRAIGNSLSGMTFMLPWGYVAIAIGMTVFIMVLSVAYGMHRCKADNVVEALRSV